MGKDVKRVNAYNPETGKNAVAIMIGGVTGVIKFAGGLIIAVPKAIINVVFKSNNVWDKE